MGNNYSPITNKNDQDILVGAIVLFKEYKGKNQYLIVKNKEGKEWEVPKVIVRKGESSVRAVLRLTGEQLSMSARVLEEVGRDNKIVEVNGKVVIQRIYYYLMMQRSQGGEVLGFEEFAWVDFSEAVKRLASKKEKEVLEVSKPILKEWEKTKKYKMEEEEEAKALEESLALEE